MKLCHDLGLVRGEKYMVALISCIEAKSKQTIFRSSSKHRSESCLVIGRNLVMIT